MKPTSPIAALGALCLLASCAPAPTERDEQRDAARETADPSGAGASSSARPDPLDVYEPAYTPPVVQGATPPAKP